jgi:plasmid stabilization system protein ParE
VTRRLVFRPSALADIFERYSYLVEDDLIRVIRVLDGRMDVLRILEAER